MRKSTRSIDKMIEEQVRKWQIMRAEMKKEETPHIPVITISREPGSGGLVLANKLAERLGFDLFHQKIIQGMAESAKVEYWMLETQDEKGLSVLEHWVSSLVNRRHLWPDQHLKQLMKMVATIGEQGRAIIMGRGANFIIPTEKRFSLRIIAPLEVRVKNVSGKFEIPLKEAKRRILRTESDRRAFARKYFYADIAAPLNYDLVINTGTVSIDIAVGFVESAFAQQT